MNTPFKKTPKTPKSSAGNVEEGITNTQNATGGDLEATLKSEGVKITKIHPTAKVAPSAQIDPSVEIPEGCVIRPNVVIREGTVLGRNVYIGANTSITKGACPSKGTIIGEGTEIGDYVIIGDNVIISDKTQIKKEGRIGHNSIIKGSPKNLIISRYSVINEGGEFVGCIGQKQPVSKEKKSFWKKMLEKFH